jgi:hypothetical protein
VAWHVKKFDPTWVPTKYNQINKKWSFTCNNALGEGITKIKAMLDFASCGPHAIF